MAEKELAEKFIEALRNLEENRDVEGIAAMFTEDAEIHNVVTIENEHQLDARTFWTNYRNSFGEVRSEFRNRIASEKSAALEWTTSGTTNDGQEFKYEGVSILEFDGDRVARFFAYFNPAKLGHQMQETAARTKEA